MFYACQNGEAEILKHLLNVKKVDSEGHLKSGFVLDDYHKTYGMNCLHAAVKHGHHKIVDMLLLAVKNDEFE